MPLQKEPHSPRSSATRNGDTPAVVQDVASRKREQETAALLSMSAPGDRHVEAGRDGAGAEVFERASGAQRGWLS